MEKDRAVVNPIRTERSPVLPPVAIMVSTTSDLDMLCRLLHRTIDKNRQLYNSRLYQVQQPECLFSIVGPFVGSPYAVMILETLIAWGARRFIFFGWCGAISPDVKIGDILIPSAAIIDEGTSGHYSDGDVSRSQPSAVITTELKSALDAKAQSFHEGPVWTTDAIFRETKDKVRHFRKQGALAVEMELSALYTVAEFRGVDIGGILVVSDELSSLQWQPGFKQERFKQARETVCNLLEVIARKQKDAE